MELRLVGLSSLTMSEALSEQRSLQAECHLAAPDHDLIAKDGNSKKLGSLTGSLRAAAATIVEGCFAIL